MNLIRALLANPFAVWIKWYIFLLKQAYIHRGKNLCIRQGAVFSNCHFGRFNTLYEGSRLAEVELGDFSYVGRNNHIVDATIGKFVCIGPDVFVGLPKHPSRDYVSVHPAFYSTAGQAQIVFATDNSFKEQDRVVIGNDVWIGARALIMGGVEIGNGAIVGAGAIVTKDVPPYSIVAGVPAQLIRYRFNHDQIAALQKAEWWNNDLDWFRKNSTHFSHIEDFINHSNR